MGKVVMMKEFPDDLHYRLKVFAAIHNTTMKEVFIKALTEYLERNGG